MTSAKKRILLGLTGSYCSGKDTVAEYLVRRKKFSHYSLSDELRRELKTHGIEPSRENLIAVGTELRRKEGNAVLARRVLARVKKNADLIVTSIRHPAEVRALKENPDFVLVFVDAPVDIRFKRMRSRKRAGDPGTLTKFRALEKKESRTKGPGQQLGECRKMADITVVNDLDSLEKLYSLIDALISELRGLTRRK